MIKVYILPPPMIILPKKSANYIEKGVNITEEIANSKEKGVQSKNEKCLSGPNTLP